MYHTVPGHKGAVCDLHIAGEQGTAGYNRLIANLTVMGDMGVLHQVIIVSNNRAAAWGCSPMDLTVLPKDIPVADLEAGLLLGVVKVLWFVANDRSHMNDIVLTNFCPAAENGMGQHPASGPHPNGSVNHDIRPDVGLRSNISPGINDRGRVYWHGEQ